MRVALLWLPCVLILAPPAPAAAAADASVPRLDRDRRGPVFQKEDPI